MSCLSSWRDITGNQAVRPDLRALPHGYGTKYSGARTDHDAIADRRMAFTSILGSRSERYIVIEHHLVTNDRSLSDHYSHAVVDEESPADPSPRMDLDPGLAANVI